jgi:hypothetical protein
VLWIELLDSDVQILRGTALHRIKLTQQFDFNNVVVEGEKDIAALEDSMEFVPCGSYYLRQELNNQSE